mgnify:CR=1 FL=1
MKRLKISIFLSLISITCIFSQKNIGAEQVINNLIANANNNVIKTEFILSVFDKKIKGTKFMLEMDDNKVWFDGKTQWALMLQNNEVSITEPTVAEIAEINPMAILSGFKAKSILKFSKLRSVKNHIVELTPKQKANDFTIIEVQIEKNTGNLKSMKLFTKDGSTLLTLNNYKSGLKIPDDTFTFNKLKYKGITINDLR